jgi:hypothetical protein
VRAEADRARRAEGAPTTRSLLPHRLCTRRVCRHGCVPAVRRSGARIAREASAEAASVWAEHHGRSSAMEPIVQSLAGSAEGDAQVAYCAAAHLARDGVAFNVAGKDIRTQLADGVTRIAAEVGHLGRPGSWSEE